jgi:hypothetical protein
MDSDTYNDMAGSISDLTEECRDRGLEITRLRGLLGEIEKDIIFVLTEWEPMESSSRATLEAAEERIADEFRTNK